MKSTIISIKINTLLWQQWSLRTASTNAIIFSHDIVKSERINRHLYTFSPTGIHLSPYRFDWLRTIFTHHSEFKYLLTNIWYFDNFIFFNRIHIIYCLGLLNRLTCLIRSVSRSSRQIDLFWYSPTWLL